MFRHRVAIVRDQDAAFFCGEGQNIRIRQTAKLGVINGLEINGGLAAAQRFDDGIAEISVRLKLDLH